MEHDAQEVKEIFGQRAKDYILSGLNLEEKGGKILCPLHTEKTPSMSWFKDGLMWRCNACKGQIDIYTYLMEYERLTFPQAVEKAAEMAGVIPRMTQPVTKKYILPNIKTRELSQQAIGYMAKRKITKETLDAWRVKEREWNGQPVYVFQYFDETEKLIYVSYRGIGKGAIKGGCEPDTKPILWGMWHIDKDKPVVITEGQPDAMAVYEAGYKNVVSVPNGSNNFKWIDNCWEWLQGVKEFIVFADNDEPGRQMADTIKRRLKNVKILIPERKDANEILYFDGKKAVLDLIDSAINAMPDGLLDVSQMEYKPVSDSTYTIETGFIEYDSHVEDWKLQEITVICGRNGEGKTTFISQIITHCLAKNVPTFLYSGEMSDNKIQAWIYRQLIGEKTKYLRLVKTKYKEKAEPKPEVIRAIKEWHKDRFYLYDRSAKETAGNLDKFFEIMELAAKRFGCKLFIVDNLMAILEENADSLYSDQANFIQRCKDFAVANWVHVVLLTHPNKEKGELQNAYKGNLEKTDISGSNNIPNKADNIIMVERNWGEDRDWDSIITSHKDRESGQRKVMLFYFSPETLRFYNDRTSEKRTFGWERFIRTEDHTERVNIPPWDMN